LLERLKNDRQDPTLSDTIRVLLLDHLAENSYLEEREESATYHSLELLLDHLAQTSYLDEREKKSRVGMLGTA